jgi:hypothetical protein
MIREFNYTFLQRYSTIGYIESNCSILITDIILKIMHRNIDISEINSLSNRNSIIFGDDVILTSNPKFTIKTLIR